MLKKNKVIAFVLLFVSIFNIFIPIQRNQLEAHGNSGDINILFTASFSYWKDPTTGKWLYDDSSGGKRHTFDGPGSTIYSYDFPSVSVPNYKIKSIETYSSNKSYSNLQEYTTVPRSDIKDYMVKNYHLNNTSQHIGKTGRVTLNATFTSLSLGSSKPEPGANNITVYTNYVPVVITLQPDGLDTVTAKYQDNTGKTIKASDNYAPSKEGYFPVNAATIQGYDLISHPNGRQDVYIGKTGKNHEVIFIYKLKQGQEPPPDPVGDIWVNIIVPSLVEEGKSFDVKQTSDSTYPIVKIEWFENKSHIKAHDGKFEGYRTRATDGQWYGVKITDSKGNTAFDEKYVDVAERVPDYISADLFFDGIYPESIELTYDDIINDREFEISAWISGERSSTNAGYIRDFWYWIDKEKSELPAIGGEGSADHYVRLSRSEYEESPYYSSVKATFKVKPSDPTMIASLRVANSISNDKLYADTTAYATYNFIRPKTKPPTTKITLPDIFWPKEVTSSTNIKNVITWNYNSEDNIPYRHSIVSLYKLEYDEEGPVLYPVFEDQIQTKRELIVEGKADEEYRIEVRVVDNLDGKSNVASDKFIYINAKPDISLKFDTSKEYEEKLGINIKNNTPQEIEDLLPSHYTSWVLKDAKGNILLEGEGEAPKWVEMDARYYGTVVTGTQYAENILGNEARARDRYSNNSRVDFRIVPNRLFETELAAIEDRSKRVTNKEWSIRNTLDILYSPLLLDEDLRFTKDFGTYQVKLEGDGKVAQYKYLYQYSNNYYELKNDPKPLSEQELSTYGANLEYVHESGEWEDDEIDMYNYEVDGTKYRYRRYKSVILLGDQRMNAIRNVEFLSTKPIAGLLITGDRKEYKKVILDGRVSIDATNAELQAKYPIQFDHPLTQFRVEPIEGINGPTDYSKNLYIHGVGKEEIDGIVTFRGKGLQEIRVDKEGWYKVSYKVYNLKKESDWVAQEIYISPELPITVDIEVGNAEVYRDPNNALKSKLDVIVTYNTPDDEIDKEKSKLFVEYQENGNFEQDVNKAYWISNNNDNLYDFINSTEMNFENNKIKFALYTDNEEKNLFGYFRFNFEAIEKPKIPNFEHPSFPEVPMMAAATFLVDDKKKIVLVDNSKPYIELTTGRENTVEVWIIEESGNPIDADALLNQLKLNRVKTKIYIIQQDGKVRIISN